MANASQLSSEEKARYGKVYCGICRALRLRGGKLARLGLQYDMAFLALLLMSLYEPQEQEGSAACRLHPIKPRPWVDGQYIRYAADMNLALAYYKSLDDAADEGSLSGRWGARVFGREQQEPTPGNVPRSGNASKSFPGWRRKTAPILTCRLPASGS